MKRSNIELLNMDCMKYMATLEDDAFDLSIVDPPYGIERFKNAQPSRISRYSSNGSGFNDLKPKKDYFKELKRVSKNQIIWGYNHFSDMLRPTKEFIFWYKHQPVDSYSDGELAWTSFTKTAKCFDYKYFGAINSDIIRIHPTQKPVKLYEWLLINYAKEGDKILDTHGGSMSLAIACHNLKFDLVCTELDKDYYEQAVKRFNNHKAQIQLF